MTKYLPIVTDTLTMCLGVFDDQHSAGQALVEFYLALPRQQELLEGFKRITNRVHTWEDAVYHEFEDDDHLLYTVYLYNPHANYLDLVTSYSDWVLKDNSGVNHLQNIAYGLSNDTGINDSYIPIDTTFMAAQWYNPKAYIYEILKLNDVDRGYQLSDV